MNIVENFLLPFMPKRKQKTVDDGPRYADIYVRTVAACVDLAILALIFTDAFQRITAATYRSVDMAMFQQATQSPSLGEGVHLLVQSNALKVMAFNAVIQVFMIGVVLIGVQWLWGTTPGKWLMDVRVKHAVTHEPPSRLQIALRFLAYLPACAPLMMGVLWASFNKKRRGWHDYMARTVVVHNHPAGWHWQQVKRGFFWLKQYIAERRK
jgi:hypothetical protein